METNKRLTLQQGRSQPILRLVVVDQLLQPDLH